MVHSVFATNNWSDWYDINENIKNSLPDKPGVYEIKANFEINRLKGSSKLVYIGSASDSIKKRLSLKLFGNFTGLDRADKWLYFHSIPLKFRYRIAKSEGDAKYLEGLLLWDYENMHWEIPPGNDKLEKKAITDKIQQNHKGTSVEYLLRGLLAQNKSNKEISAIFDVPEYIIENLRVYFLL